MALTLLTQVFNFTKNNQLCFSIKSIYSHLSPRVDIDDDNSHLMESGTYPFRTNLSVDLKNGEICFPLLKRIDYLIYFKINIGSYKEENTIAKNFFKNIITCKFLERLIIDTMHCETSDIPNVFVKNNFPNLKELHLLKIKFDNDFVISCKNLQELFISDEYCDSVGDIDFSECKKLYLIDLNLNHGTFLKNFDLSNFLLLKYLTYYQETHYDSGYMAYREDKIDSLFRNVQECENIIISDVRFPDEQISVKNRNGVVILVNSNKNTNSSIYMASRSTQHASETSLNGIAPDYIVENNGTLKELKKNVKNIIRKAILKKKKTKKQP